MMTFGGSNIFGTAVKLQHLSQPNAQQVNTYFGVSGAQTLYGGGRGRTFAVSGVLIAPTIADLNTAEAAFQSYADGIARTLVDSRGRVWANVLFKGEFTPDSRGPYPTSNGWALPYRALFYGLS
jgi:hypothetical protein